METSTTIATTGVFILLLAFFANLIKWQKPDGWVYLFLNFAGAALACYASCLIHFLPFIILEGTWTAVALVALGRKLFSN